jgi:hypothetical protein
MVVKFLMILWQEGKSSLFLFAYFMELTTEKLIKQNYCFCRKLSAPMMELTSTPHTHVCEDRERRAACRQFLASEANRLQTNFWRAKRAFGSVLFFRNWGRGE